MNKPTQHPPDKLVCVSHETIYCAIYAMPRGTLRTELVGLLRKSHKTRLPRTRGTARKGCVPNMKLIDLRPPEVAARIVPGHWEGDLIKGAMNRSSVGTLVERLSRYVMLVKLDGNTAEDVLKGFTRRLKSVPESLRKTMTYDQGSEMALHEKLSANLHMDIFFCDPHSPWQRGSNENANGLVREYLPKGMDLSNVTHQELTAIEHSLNNRPRKILNFHSPQEVFSMLTSDLIRGVALQASNHPWCDARVCEEPVEFSLDRVDLHWWLLAEPIRHHASPDGGLGTGCRLRGPALCLGSSFPLLGRDSDI